MAARLPPLAPLAPLAPLELRLRRKDSARSSSSETSRAAPAGALEEEDEDEDDDDDDDDDDDEDEDDDDEEDEEEEEEEEEGSADERRWAIAKTPAEDVKIARVRQNCSFPGAQIEILASAQLRSARRMLLLLARGLTRGSSRLDRDVTLFSSMSQGTMSRAQDLLVVGGGLTGFSIAAALPAALQARAALWEKSASPGRLAVSRARGAAAPAVCDLGAQYFSAVDARSAAALAELEASGLVARLPPAAVDGARAGHDSVAHYAAVGGTASVVDAHLAPRAAAGGLQVRRNTRLTSLTAEVLAEGAEGPGGVVWRAADEAGGSALFRAVALTVPAPQALQLGGDVQAVLAASGLAPPLRGVTYSSRLAVALHFARESAPALEAALPWAGRFVDRGAPGGAVVRYLSNESRKRGLTVPGGASYCPAFIAHSTVEYGALHENTADYAQALGPELVASACAALEAAIGAPLAHAPIETRVHRWKYSQVTRGVSGPDLEEAAAAAASAAAAGGEAGASVRVQDGGAAVRVDGVALAGGMRSPPLVIAGDYMTASHFAGCLRSAEAARALLEQ